MNDSNFDVARFTSDILKSFNTSMRGEARLINVFDLYDECEDFARKINESMNDLIEKRKTNNPRIIQNAIYSLCDNNYYKSRHRHDYVPIPLKEGFAFIDGGLDYIRSSGTNIWLVDYSLYENSSDDDIYNKLLWGTYGIDGKQPLTWVLLKDCTTDHLNNIIANVPSLDPLVIKVISRALDGRKK